jgi:hypothetical protein
VDVQASLRPISGAHHDAVAQIHDVALAAALLDGLDDPLLNCFLRAEQHARVHVALQPQLVTVRRALHCGNYPMPAMLSKRIWTGNNSCADYLL